MILDEASSRLDPATETLMEQAIDRLFTGRSGVIIAHRLRTLDRADEILFLENGRASSKTARGEAWQPILALASTASCRPAWRRYWYDAQFRG